MVSLFRRVKIKRYNMRNLGYLSVVILLLSCSGVKQGTSEEEWIPSAWVHQRVNGAKDRLAKSEGGQLVWESIEAHGGLEKWFANGALSFHFDYQPLDGKVRRNSFQTIDQWSVRSVHELATDRSVHFGWDGANAWVYPDTAEVPVNVRFWANTPFYFLGLPFVVSDEGIQYEVLPADTLDNRVYDLVRITFKGETGDAPDDFYVLYIDQQTKLLGALRYIVSYPGFFPDGGHSPEKIMKVKGLTNVDGIRLSSGYETYWWKESVAGEHITNIDVSDVSFKKELSEDFFEMPEGSRIQESL